MNARRTIRTKTCTAADAKARLASARAFLDTAELVSQEQPDALRDVAVSNAVHAGMAAADALCCFYARKHSTGSDHDDAVAVLRTVRPVGQEAASSLKTLIGLKGKAQYLPTLPSRNEVKTALRQAQRLVEMAERALIG